MSSIEEEGSDVLTPFPYNRENISEEETPRNKRPHEIDIHYNQNSEEEDYNITTRLNEFSIVKRTQETSHKQRIYAVAFNPFDTDETHSVFATAAKNVVHIYTSENNTKKMELKRVIIDTNQTEDYYAVNWCYDQIEQRSKIIVAGECGFIKVVDPETGVILHEKFGHGDTVNELRTDPNNSMIFASVSKDNSARVWHIRRATSLVCLGGQKGHLDQVLSCDWAPDSSFLVTCSMDHSIKLWYFNEEARRLFDNSLYEKDEDDEPSQTLLLDSTGRRGPVFIQFPCNECTDLHTDYVDCIRFIGWYLISKGSERAANIFRFGHPGEPPHKDFPYRTDRVTTLIKTLVLPKCDVWFLKFDVSPIFDWAVFGGTDGRLLFFDLSSSCFKPAFEMAVSRRPIRQVCFSPCGNTIITVGDDYTITKILRKTRKWTPI